MIGGKVGPWSKAATTSASPHTSSIAEMAPADTGHPELRSRGRTAWDRDALVNADAWRCRPPAHQGGGVTPREFQRRGRRSLERRNRLDSLRADARTCLEEDTAEWRNRHQAASIGCAMTVHSIPWTGADESLEEALEHELKLAGIPVGCQAPTSEVTLQGILLL